MLRADALSAGIPTDMPGPPACCVRHGPAKTAMNRSYRYIDVERRGDVFCVRLRFPRLGTKSARDSTQAVASARALRSDRSPP